MTSFVSIVNTSRSELVYLAKGLDKPTQKPAWYYVQVKSKHLLPLFLKFIKSGIDLLDYSVILYSGWGTEPPEEIRKKIHDEFG